jgi:hypothetical protein
LVVAEYPASAVVVVRSLITFARLKCVMKFWYVWSIGSPVFKCLDEEACVL